MKIENQVCTLEQAKRLNELGVNAETFFWWMQAAEFDEEGEKIIAWHPVLSIEQGLDCFSLSEFNPSLTNEDGEFHETRGNWTAYSVAELGEMLPPGYDSMRVTGYNPEQFFWLAYDLDGKEFPANGSWKTEAQARAAMLIHLLESKLITVEEINNRLT